MSNTSTSESTSLVCANCGKEGSEVTNTCNKCKSVMYCNAACKKKHRHKHKKDCEEHVKRAAENAAKLHDEQLFKQPPPNEDCPICFLRLPSLNTGRVYMNCCGKMICRGCTNTVQSRATKEEEDICPFCRSLPPYSEGEMIKRYEKRMTLNDAQAIYSMGYYYSNGELGLPRNHAKALELYHRAAELGSVESYSSIGTAYKDGIGIAVERDEKKAKHYYELGAMGGDTIARNKLGVGEARSGNMKRAMKHFMIAARDGDSNSLAAIKELYKLGLATKDDYTEALRSYQAYLNEIKSDQRDEAAAFNDSYRYYNSAV